MKLVLLIAALVAIVLASPDCPACLFNYQYACVNDLHTICVDIPEVGLPECPMPEMELITDIDECPYNEICCDPFVECPEPCCYQEGRGVAAECECEQTVTPLPFCYQPPTEDRTGGVVFTYEADEDAFIPRSECYNHVDGLVDAGQPSYFVEGNEDPAFYINFPIDRTYVTWTLGDLQATVDHTAPPIGLPVCDDLCTGDCETCSTSAEEYGIHCLWCPDLESEDPATEGECLSNFGPETPEDICEDPRYGEEPDCIFNTTGPVCPELETCGECAEAEGCVWCNSDCGCVFESEAETECLQYDVPGVLVDAEEDCRLTDAADYVDPCAGIDEYDALQALFNATNGPGWNDSTGWDGLDICNFFGVDCAGKILDLSGNNLDGQLPTEFFCISSFQTVDLSNNNLDGCIPESLGSMAGVQILNLSENELTCDIPVTIGNPGPAASLKYLYLQFNRLGCEIPDTFCELLPIQEFHLEVNMLRGIIPECIMAPVPLGELFEAHFECNSLEEPYEGYIEDLRNGITRYGGGNIYNVPDPAGGQLWDSEAKEWIPCPVFNGP